MTSASEPSLSRIAPDRLATVETGAGMDAFHDPRTDAIVAAMQAAGYASRPNRTLVVGCGSGVEAAVLGRTLGTQVTGIDLRTDFDRRAAAAVELCRGDARHMTFADQSFDFVYSYHALEHIDDYRRALAEMHRVLRPGGAYCIGTPNRSRLVGYIGSTDAGLATKLRWNLQEWSARLRGRFRNEYGAHAGFTAAELGSALREAFGEARDISDAYYRALYPGHRRLVNGLQASGLGRIAFPSIYFFGRKLGGDDR